MKKIVMSLMALVVMTIGANATYEIDPLIKECTLNPLSPLCHPTLLKGDTGDTGLTGATGETGKTGAAGSNGVDGTTTVIHQIDNTLLASFASEVDQEVSLVQAKIDREVRAIQAEIKRATEYANDVVAMNQATSAIDFGTASKGSFEMGAGFGYSSSYSGNGKAGALGFKYGTSENTAIVVKGARSINRSDTYAVGVGGTIKF